LATVAIIGAGFRNGALLAPVSEPVSVNDFYTLDAACIFYHRFLTDTII
jgi:hypothetical protein